VTSESFGHAEGRTWVFVDDAESAKDVIVLPTEIVSEERVTGFVVDEGDDEVEVSVIDLTVPLLRVKAAPAASTSHADGLVEGDVNMRNESAGTGIDISVPALKRITAALQSQRQQQRHRAIVDALQAHEMQGLKVAVLPADGAAVNPTTPESPGTAIRALRDKDLVAKRDRLLDRAAKKLAEVKASK